MAKRILLWGGIAFLIFFMAFRPEASMDVVRTLGQTFIDIGQGIGKVFS